MRIVHVAEMLLKISGSHEEIVAVPKAEIDRREKAYRIRFGHLCAPTPLPAAGPISAIRSGRIIPPASTASGGREVEIS
jgi:hypothetical protein